MVLQKVQRLLLFQPWLQFSRQEYLTAYRASGSRNYERAGKVLVIMPKWWKNDMTLDHSQINADPLVARLFLENHLYRIYKRAPLLDYLWKSPAGQFVKTPLGVHYSYHYTRKGINTFLDSFCCLFCHHYAPQLFQPHRVARNKLQICISNLSFIHQIEREASSISKKQNASSFEEDLLFLNGVSD